MPTNIVATRRHEIGIAGAIFAFAATLFLGVGIYCMTAYGYGASAAYESYLSISDLAYYLCGRFDLLFWGGIAFLVSLIFIALLRPGERGGVAFFLLILYFFMVVVGVAMQHWPYVLSAP